MRRVAIVQSYIVTILKRALHASKSCIITTAIFSYVLSWFERMHPDFALLSG